MRVELHQTLNRHQEAEWLQFWRTCQHSHPRQHLALAAVEFAKGRRPIFVTAKQDGALVLVGAFSIRPVLPRGRGSFEAICQRGPLFDEPAHLEGSLPEILSAMTDLAIGSVRISPRWVYPAANDVASLFNRHEFTLCKQVWGDRVFTGTIDLNSTEDELLASFSSSTRAQIRLAERKGIVVHPGMEVNEALAFYAAYEAMRSERGLPWLQRNEFLETFSRAWRSQELGVLLNAYYGDEFLGGLALVSDARGVYPARYALARDIPAEVRTVRVGALLWWHAMKWAKRRNCEWLDVEGYKDDVAPTDPLYDVCSFKGGFRPRPVTVLGEHVLVCNRAIYGIARGRAVCARAFRYALSAPYRLRKRFGQPSRGAPS